MNIKKYILIIFFLFLTYGVGTASEAINPTQQETDLLNLINEARKNPIAVAYSLGMDTEKIMNDFPEMENILINGLAPLTFNKELYGTATDHRLDMLGNNYYARDSFGGWKYYERISEKLDYDPVVIGEYLGFLEFRNFIKADIAVRLIFEKMFREELTPGRNEMRYILNPSLVHVGISVAAGGMNLDGVRRNGYWAVCDFVSYKVNPVMIELALFDMINQLRNEPSQVFDVINIDKALDLGGSQYKDELLALKDEKIAPVAWDEKLRAAARNHNKDMIQNVYFDHLSPEGSGPAERVISMGYETLNLEEVLYAQVLNEYNASEDIARLILKNVIKNEYDNKGILNNILNSDLSEAGIAIETVVLNSDNQERMFVCLLVVDLAKPKEQRSFVIGNVFKGLIVSAEALSTDSVFGYQNPICIKPDGKPSGLPGLNILLNPLGIGNSEEVSESVSVAYGLFQILLPSYGLFEIVVKNDESEFLISDSFLNNGKNRLKYIWVCNE